MQQTITTASNVRLSNFASESWQSARWVLLVFTILVVVTLLGSFVSYEFVLSNGHPWLPKRHCPGCLLCGMTRSFCAMSNGDWQLAREWNKGGPALYIGFWLWLLASFVYSVVAARNFVKRRITSS